MVGYHKAFDVVVRHRKKFGVGRKTAAIMLDIPEVAADPQITHAYMEEVVDHIEVNSWGRMSMAGLVLSFKCIDHTKLVTEEELLRLAMTLEVEKQK